MLILGSMPGGESLRWREYYAFPRNAFWRIMAEICGFPPDAPYAARLRGLAARGIALWDVLAACERSGSLDAAIRAPRPNDVPGLLARCPSITRVCCNGQAARRYLRRYFPETAARAVVLPSTSPAAAMFSYAEKLARWQAAVLPL